MAAPTPQELAASAAFQGLLSVGAGIVAAHAKVLRGMTPDQLRAHVTDIEVVLAALRERMADRSEVSDSELARLAELAGLAPATIRALADRVHTYGTEVVNENPELRVIDERARTLLFLDVVTRDESTMAVLKRAAEGDGDDDPADPCQVKCTTEFIFDLVKAQLDALSRMIACIALVFPPLVLLCSAIMLAIMIYEMSRANDQYTRCIEACADDRG